MARPPDDQRSAGGISIRAASEEDRDAIWKIFQETIRTGDTFVHDASTPRDKALAYWCAADAATFVAEQDGNVIGSYLLRPNQPGLGDHVANAGYMVDPNARGFGAGRAMGEHSLDEARRRGYRAMQFNFVVSTNESAVHLWRQLGFNIVGTLPGRVSPRAKRIRGCLCDVPLVGKLKECKRSSTSSPPGADRCATRS